jgi:hypothetical protein
MKAVKQWRAGYKRRKDGWHNVPGDIIGAVAAPANKQYHQDNKRQSEFQPNKKSVT